MYNVVNDIAGILQEMKIPNSVKQRANDLLIREGFYALADVKALVTHTTKRGCRIGAEEVPKGRCRRGAEEVPKRCRRNAEEVPKGWC